MTSSCLFDKVTFLAMNCKILEDGFKRITRAYLVYLLAHAIEYSHFQTMNLSFCS
jgi:hypothetical protein